VVVKECVKMLIIRSRDLGPGGAINSGNSKNSENIPPFLPKNGKKNFQPKKTPLLPFFGNFFLSRKNTPPLPVFSLKMPKTVKKNDEKFSYFQWLFAKK